MTSGQLTGAQRKKTKSFVPPTFISVAFHVFGSNSLQLFADFLVQDGESVTGAAEKVAEARKRE